MLLIYHILLSADLALKLIFDALGLFGHLLLYEFDLLGEGIAHAVDLINGQF